MITVTEHDKREWSRMAQDAYAKDRNDMGHKFSGAAAMRKGETMGVGVFDGLQRLYRAWLVFGWAEVDRLASDATNKTEYARGLGYSGRDPVIVVDGRVVSHGRVDWFEFCNKLRRAALIGGAS